MSGVNVEPGRAKQGIHEPSECESDRAKQVIEVLGEIRIASSIQYSERLFRSIEFLFHYLPFELSDIDLFAAACGPGSFTGLASWFSRYGGFCHGPQQARSRCHHASGSGVEDRCSRFLIAPMIDARRGDIYGAVFRRDRHGSRYSC